MRRDGHHFDLDRCVSLHYLNGRRLVSRISNSNKEQKMAFLDLLLETLRGDFAG